MLEELIKYKNIFKNTEDSSSNNDTLITFFCYNKKISELVNIFEEQLSNIKKINNPIKKNKLYNGYNSLITKVSEDLSEDFNISSIFFVGEFLIEIKLTQENVKTAIEYKFPQYFLKTENYFLIDYIIDLFFNFNFIYTFQLNNASLNITKINKNKEKEIKNLKIIKENNIIEEIDLIRKENNYKENIILYGTSPLLNKLTIINNLKNVIIKKDNYSRELLYQIYEDEKMKKNHELLEKKLGDLQNEKTNIDLYVFGKLKIEIKEAIESYLLKELYIDEEKLNKLKIFIDDSFFNFTIIPIRKLENGDIADNFIKDYNGIMGIKYY
jgi:hypothetical protein